MLYDELLESTVAFVGHAPQGDGVKSITKHLEAAEYADNCDDVYVNLLASSKAAASSVEEFGGCDVVDSTSFGGFGKHKKWLLQEEQEVGEEKTQVASVEDLCQLIEEEKEQNELDSELVSLLPPSDQDALNVEQISDVFSCLENVNVEATLEVQEEMVGQEIQPQDQEEEDAANVDFVSDLFSSLEQESCADVPEHVVDESEEPSDASESFTAQDAEDAENVEFMSALFDLQCDDVSETSPMESTEQVEQETSEEDIVDAQAVDEMSALFSELEEREQQKQQPVVQEEQQAEPAAGVDSRVFVPSFMVRIEGRPSMAGPQSSSGLLAGPPRPGFLVGPPRPPCVSVAMSVPVATVATRLDNKRKAMGAPDPTLSAVRRACAAKRQRVKGRFTSEKPAFVSITALQH